VFAPTGTKDQDFHQGIPSPASTRPERIMVGNAGGGSQTERLRL
jgi:hypothetical protein